MAFAGKRDGALRNFESGAANPSMEFLFVATLAVNFGCEYHGAIARQQ
jgi:hypothetical protein